MNKGSNPSAVLKHCLAKRKISQQEFEEYVVDWANISPGFSGINCSIIPQLIKQVLPQYILDLYRKKTDPKFKRQIKKFREYRTGGKIHKRYTKKIKSIKIKTVRQFIKCYRADREIFRIEVDTRWKNHCNVEGVNFSHPASKAAREKELNRKLADKYGYNFSWVDNSDWSIDRYVVKYWGELMFVRDYLLLQQQKKDDFNKYLIDGTSIWNVPVHRLTEEQKKTRDDPDAVKDFARKSDEFMKIMRKTPKIRDKHIMIDTRERKINERDIDYGFYEESPIDNDNKDRFSRQKALQGYDPAKARIKLLKQYIEKGIAIPDSVKRQLEDSIRKSEMGDLKK